MRRQPIVIVSVFIIPPRLTYTGNTTYQNFGMFMMCMIYLYLMNRLVAFGMLRTLAAAHDTFLQIVFLVGVAEAG